MSRVPAGAAGAAGAAGSAHERPSAARQAGAITTATLRMWRNALRVKRREEPGVVLTVAALAALVGGALIVGTALFVGDVLGDGDVLQRLSVAERAALDRSVIAGWTALVGAMALLLQFSAGGANALDTIVRLRRISPLGRLLGESTPVLLVSAALGVFLGGGLLVAFAVARLGSADAGPAFLAAHLTMTGASTITVVLVVGALQRVGRAAVRRLASVTAPVERVLGLALPALWLVVAVVVQYRSGGSAVGSALLVPGLVLVGDGAPATGRWLVGAVLTVAVGGMVSWLAARSAGREREPAPALRSGGAARLPAGRRLSLFRLELTLALRDPSLRTTAALVLVAAVAVQALRLAGVVGDDVVRGALSVTLILVALSLDTTVSRTRSLHWLYRSRRLGVGRWFAPKIAASLTVVGALALVARVAIHPAVLPASDEAALWGLVLAFVAGGLLAAFVARPDPDVPLAAALTNLLGAAIGAGLLLVGGALELGTGGAQLVLSLGALGVAVVVARVHAGRLDVA